MKDNSNSGRPSTSFCDDNVERVLDCIRRNRRLTVRMIKDELHGTETTIHRILREDLGMRKIVLKMLSTEQKTRKVDVCENWLRADSNFLDSIVGIMIL